MKQYMLTMKGSQQEWDHYSPVEKQKLMEQYFSFVDDLKLNHNFKAGSALDDRSVRLRSESGLIVTEGPTLESNIGLTGYMIFEAKDLMEAAQIAKKCPALTHGETVEVSELVSHDF